MGQRGLRQAHRRERCSKGAFLCSFWRLAARAAFDIADHNEPAISDMLSVKCRFQANLALHDRRRMNEIE